MVSCAIPPSFESLPVFKDGHDMPGASAKGVMGAHGIRAFRHRASALRVVLCNVPGPLVSSTIIVGTEPISNAGHPHTLEHAVFLGSFRHPHRGYLDNLACRCYSDGTNAWTDDEYTAYTASTAGLQGLLNLLPCFLDHILRPNLSRASFDSEVYHIRHDGAEAGVVFCEMQARENTEDDLAESQLHRTLYESTPLAYNSGGLCDDIRTLTHHDISAFHTSQYAPANVSIVISGSDIVAADLLGSIQPLLDDITSRPGFTPGLPRWRTALQLQPLPPVSRTVLPFPSDDQSIGTINFAWRGPGSIDRIESIAIEVILRYLAGDVWSPLRQRFVEIEDQLASDICAYQETFYSTGSFTLSFQGVQHLGDSDDSDEDDDDDGEDVDPDVDGDEAAQDDGEGVRENLNGSQVEMSVSEGNREVPKESFLLSKQLETSVMDYLRSICDSGELPGGLSAIHVALKKEREYMLSCLESASHSSIPFYLASELVFGQDGVTIGEELRGFFEQCDIIQEKDMSFWISVIRKRLLEAPRIELVLVPDEQLSEKLAEKDRLAQKERVARLGKEALSELGKENEERIASLKVVKFKADAFPPIPSTQSISSFPYTVSRECRRHFIYQSVALETEFIHCTISLDTKCMSSEQRLWLPMLCSVLSTCDIVLDDGSRVKYTDNSRAISEVIMGNQYGIQLGYSRSMAHQCVVVHFTALPESFEKATALLLRTLFQSEVTAERVSAISQTMHAECTAQARDADTILNVALSLVPFMVVDWDRDIPNNLLGSLPGLTPITSLLSEELSSKGGNKMVKERMLKGMDDCLQALRKRLSPCEVMVEIAARDPDGALTMVERIWAERSMNGDGLKNTDSSNGTVDGSKGEPELPIARRVVGRLKDLLKGHGTVGKVIGIGGVDSSFIEARVDTEVFVGHSDWSAVSVLLEMLCRVEGPLSDAVRVSGLAYGAEMGVSEWRAQLELIIFESSSVAAAWESVCRTLESFRKGLESDGETAEDLLVDLDTAKASMIYNLTRARSSPERIVRVVRNHSALGVPASPAADEALQEEILKVTVEDLRRVFDAHVRKVYDGREGGERVVVVTCGAKKVKETVESFAKCEWALKLEECTKDELVPKQVTALVKHLKR